MAESQKRTKGLIFDESIPIQAEAVRVLELCGHKQTRFISALIQNFIQKYGINIDLVDKEDFEAFIKLIELDSRNALSFTSTGIRIAQPAARSVKERKRPARKQSRTKSAASSSNDKRTEVTEKETKPNDTEELIDPESMEEMQEALAKFGIG